MKSSKNLAIAVDVGTTTIAASLLNLDAHLRCAATVRLNPQREFGADVISRLHAACTSPDSLKKMARDTNDAVERMAGELLADAGASWDDIRGIAIAGNPAMEHLLLELPVRSLAFPPYRPLFTAGKVVNTSILGWKAARDCYLFPLPGGFVGGDLVAFLYGVDPAGPGAPATRSSGSSPRLFLDIGTNGEIALDAGDRIYATSAAAGPAFEGGGLQHGMAAFSGAISGMRLEEDRTRLSVIGDVSPVGICGSGAIAAIACLLSAGILDAAGRLLSPAEISSNLANRVLTAHGGPAFSLYRDAALEVCLTQRDVRQVQLAKSAIRAGIEVLFEKAGLPDHVTDVVVTGSFGARLTSESLKKVGILPGKVVEICCFAPDGALAGVEKALFTSGGFEAVDRLAESIRVIPLSGTPAFEKHFLKHMNFPGMKN